MNPTSPHNRYQGAPALSSSSVGPVRAARVVEGGARLPRTVPTLTVYAEGYIQPNAEAAALLSELADGVCFHAPEPVRPGRNPKPWELSAGACHMFVPHSVKPGQLRLRAAGDCPPEGRYLLTPIAGKPGRFTLLPA